MICPACQRTVEPRHFYPNGKARCTAVRRPAGRERWTAARKWALLGWLEKGLDDAAIGAQMGITRRAVSAARMRLGLPSRREIAYTLLAVSKIMGVDEGSVRRWVDAGWLRADSGQRWGQRRCFWVTRDYFAEFLENERGFHVWTPDKMTDIFWRTFAVKARGDVRWLTTADVARRLFVAQGTVSYWLSKGYLAGRTLDGGASGPGRAWRVRESDLASFEPPTMGGTRESRLARWERRKERLKHAA